MTKSSSVGHSYLENHAPRQPAIARGTPICFFALAVLSLITVPAPPIIAAKAESDGLRHCVQQIEVKLREVYLDLNWFTLAREKATENWQMKARKRYGSPYEQWQNAQSRKSFCRRIGFGNDQKGNVGATVVCHLSAIPCAKLLKDSKIQTQLK